MLTWIQSDFAMRSLHSVPRPDDCLSWKSRSCRPQSTAQHLWKQPLPVAAGSAQEHSWANSSLYEIQRIGRVGWHAQTRAGSRLKQNTKPAFPRLCWADKGSVIQWGHDGITTRCYTVLRHHGTEGRWSYGKRVKGGAKQDESLGVCPCLVFKRVVCFGVMSTEASRVFMSRNVTWNTTNVKWYAEPVWAGCNSPTGQCFLDVPEIRAPPSRCPARGCRGSDPQRASCWADWATASPSHPAPPSAHRLALLNK